MREAIGGTWLFQIVIVFIMLFTGFMCLTINRSKAFAVKDQIIQAIQSHNGIDLTTGYSEETEDAMYDIVKYIEDKAYRNTGAVPEDLENYYCFSKDGRQEDRKPVFCIAPISVKEETCPTGAECFDELPNMVYYRVVVFFQLDLPIFQNLFNFRVVGDTKVLYGEEII